MKSTNPQPTPPAGYEILTPEVARMKPEGMKCYNPQWTEPKWVLWDRPFAPEGVALTDFTFSAPIGTTALLLTPGPEVGECECHMEKHASACMDWCPHHPRNAYVKVLPGWLAGLPDSPDDLMFANKGQSDWSHWPKQHNWCFRVYECDTGLAYAVPRHVFDALNRPWTRDPIHDEVAKMDESKLQGEQGTEKPIHELVRQMGVTNRKLRGEIRCLQRRLRDANRGAESNAKIAWSLAQKLASRTHPPVAGSGPTAEEMLDWLENNLRGELLLKPMAAIIPDSTGSFANLRSAIAQAMQSK